ncbi:MAG: Fe-S cluster assembly protein SufD [Alicyclobacillaceae bacterium]|nr:Fe-S cluster assembly protein SufD [Alicyclobacillaceae bacterium]
MAVGHAMELDRRVVESLSEGRGEPAWLREWRLRAWEAYEQLPPPKFERSDWEKRKLQDLRLAPSMASAPPLERFPAHLQGLFGERGDRSVAAFAGGGVPYLDLENLAGRGVYAAELSTAVREREDLVRRALGRVVDPAENKWIALQSALWNAGLFVHVPRGAEAEIPLLALYQIGEAGAFVFPRILIVVEEGASATVVEALVSDLDLGAAFTCGIVECLVEDGGRLRYAGFQDLPKSVTGFLVRRARAERDARVEWLVGEMGEGYIVGECGTELAGQGSRSDARVVGIGTGRQHLDLTVKMVHAGRFTESEILGRGVVLDRAETVFRAVTQIQKGAVGTSGHQAESLLILSPTARADTIPMLLIDENDVRADHAASVGKINPEQLYYLMSRGIDEEQARRLIVRGFLDPVIGRIPLPGIRRVMEELVERKMTR